MHPRGPRVAWTRSQRRRAAAVLDFVRERGVVHPREVDARFAHGKSVNWFGGSGNASTRLLDDMQYRGLLRVAGRQRGIRPDAPRRGAGTRAAARAATGRRGVRRRASRR
jgi:hypothetical protein